jgi:PAS domain S-box-containing protein
VNYQINDKVMEDTRNKILLIEDDKLDQMAFERFVKDAKLPYDCRVAASVSQAQSILACEQFDVIVSDYSIGDGTALDILDLVKDVPIIVVTGVGDEEVAIRAWKGGAYDYITKDLEMNYLKSIPKIIENAINCKKMREALDRKQKNLEAIFDATPVGMLLVDGNMKVAHVNNAIKKIVKKEYRQIINQQIGGALNCIKSTCNENAKGCGYNPDCSDCLLQETIKSIFDSGQSVRDIEIHPALKVDNKEIMPWFRMGVEPVIIDGCQYVIVTLSDITEHKKAEYERQLAEDKYRVIFENSAVAITMVDEHERLISWNRFTEDLLGMDRDDLYLKPVRSLYPAEEWERIRAYHLRQKGLQHHLLETRMIKKDGSIIEVDISLSVLTNAEGTTSGSIGIIRDITEHKKAEEKIKKMIDTKSGFISIVSHELRTSLAAIKEGVSIVFDGMAGRLNNEQKKFLNIAKRNVDRLSVLINDVLDFQKLETNRMNLDIQDNDIKEVFSEVHETMALYAKKNKVELSLELAEELSEAKFDRAKINQVLTNLVGNAIKFTPEKGKVSINVHLQNEELVISISDTGIGIPKEALPKIFECFYRVNQRDKEIQGTGLGLAIVNKIVMMHSGRIEVASEVGQGTTFMVFLPLELKPMQKLLPAKADEILNNSIAH